MNKETYELLTMDVIRFMAEDVLTISLEEDETPLMCEVHSEG